MPDPSAILVAALGDIENTSDVELLRRYAENQDSSAFELLVWRHSGLALRTCRTVLGDHHAAEDAAQAVFLALARQATQIGRQGNLAGWLYRVARRIAARAARRDRRIPVEAAIEPDRLPTLSPPAPDYDLERLLHEELRRMPRKYQTPILLCFFEGLTHTAAARRLGWPIGTVAGRLARAKEMLRMRLTRRGVGLPAAAAALTILPGFASTTTAAAVRFVRDGGRHVPEMSFTLAHKEVHAMAVMRSLRIAGILVLGVGAALGLGLAAAAPPTPELPALAVAAVAPAPVEKARPPKPIVGKSFAVAPVTTQLQRTLLRCGPEVKTILFIDQSAILRDPKTIDLNSLNLGTLTQVLDKHKPDPKRSVLWVQIERVNSDDNPRMAQAELWLDYALKGMAREVGFESAWFDVHMWPSFSFDDFVAPLKEDEAVVAEDGVGDERALAFLVRSSLSRTLTRKSDCVVDVRPSAKAIEGDEPPAEYEESVQTALAKMKLKKGQRVSFKFVGKSWFGPGHASETLAVRTTKALGLELINRSYVDK